MPQLQTDGGLCQLAESPGGACTAVKGQFPLRQHPPGLGAGLRRWCSICSLQSCRTAASVRLTAGEGDHAQPVGSCRAGAADVKRR